MNPFVKFMVTPAGRMTRVVAGIALLAWGLFGITGAVGIVVAVIGLVPLVAGSVDVCVFSPLFGGKFKGTEIRGEK